MSSNFYREAVTEQSPGLPRCAATLGKKELIGVLNPERVASLTGLVATPVGVDMFE